MKKIMVLLLMLLVSQASFAKEKTKNCLKGKFGNQTYEVIDGQMDVYGNFTSQVVLSEMGTLKGKGRYFATQEEAYLETKYSDKESGLKAVVSTSFQQDGSLFTLCVGKDLKDKNKYNCIFCGDQR